MPKWLVKIVGAALGLESRGAPEGVVPCDRARVGLSSLFSYEQSTMLTGRSRFRSVTLANLRKPLEPGLEAAGEGRV